MKTMLKEFEDAICTADNAAADQLFDAILAKLYEEQTEDNRYLVSELLNKLDYSDDEIYDILNNC